MDLINLLSTSIRNELVILTKSSKAVVQYVEQCKNERDRKVDRLSK